MLKALGYGVGGSAVLAGGGLGVYYYTAKLDTVGKVSFDKALSIPPLAESTTNASGARVFTLGIAGGPALAPLRLDTGPMEHRDLGAREVPEARAYPVLPGTLRKAV